MRARMPCAGSAPSGTAAALRDDAAELAPVICKGILLDVCGAQGVEQLPAGYGIGARELEEVARRQGVDVAPGCVILVRTGAMRAWPDMDAVGVSDGAGISLDGARWLAERRPFALGNDTGAFEVQPSGIEGRPQPVHVFLLADHGIPLLEWVYLEELAAGAHYEFLFICLPLKIRGATASMVRPVAVV
jgi:kynurenine formamidase